MGLISTLKELLGMETRERPQRHDVEVTVERESDAGSERAVNEPVASATSSEDRAAGTATASSTDAAADDETETAETGDAETAESGAEDTETAGSIAEDTEPDDAEPEASEPVETEEAETVETDTASPDETETDEAETDETETAERDTEAAGGRTETDEPVKSIKGIGSAYAERLGTAGIETIGDLAHADPDTIASEADVPKARLEDWIERAKAKQ